MTLIDAETAFTGTRAPTGADVLDANALAAWLASRVDHGVTPLGIAKFAGGQSNPTYRLDTPGGAYVLRRKPFGQLLPSAHAIEREYRLIAVLRPTGFPVAKPVGLEEDAGVIGAPFYVMRLVEGRTFWDGAMPGAAPARRTATYEAMVDTLAALHAIDPDSAGLADYGRPGNYFGRQVDRWTRQYRASETDANPDMEAVIAFLAASVPEQTRTSIVHGDYRIDNLIMASGLPDGQARVAAVLDWELSTLGDPLADFTYFCMAWVTPNEKRSGVMDVDRAALGIPELPAIVERYCAATGRDGVPDMNWYFAFNFFRLAAILQGIKKRVIDGNAASDHARAMAEKVPTLATAAMGFARAAGA